MVNIDNYRISREELEKRLNWYSNRYGPYVSKKGLHNWKNLFRRPTLNEWIILFMIITALFLGGAYRHDVSECREFLSNINNNACGLCDSQLESFKQQELDYLQPGQNISFNINEENPNLGKQEGDRT
jgi:hypothetical protein